MRLERIKLFSIILVLLVVSSGFYVVCSVTGIDTRVQPENALEELESGVGLQVDDHFGWNVSYAGNLNGDLYDDIIVGAPGNDTGGPDTGAVYIFYGSSDLSTNDINATNANIVISGSSAGNRFGWDVAAAGDVNGDGTDDIIVGAPGTLNNRGKAYLFYGGTLSNGTDMDADVTLNGTLMSSELFGHSVAGAGDVNGDTYDDVIIGAPGSDRAYIFFGNANLRVRYTNLWDTDGDEATPETDFTSGLNTTANTPGPTGANDGWDWYLLRTMGIYGGDDSAVEYNADPNSDNSSADSTVAADGELIISIGEDYGDGSDSGGVGDSGAYGLELQVTVAEAALITAGGIATLSFEWSLDDIGNLNPDEEAWVKCRFGDTTTMNYLGSALDTGDNNADGTDEVWWGDDFNSVGLTQFNSDVTSYISSAGSYYLDFGGRLRNWGGFGPNEAVIIHFDNILLKISNLQEPIILQGIGGTAFGSSVTGLGDFNDVNPPRYDDVAVGAPLTIKGSTYLFYGAASLSSTIPVANADIELTGIENGELFGWAVAGAGDINNDNFNDIIIGAPSADRTYIYYGRAAFTPPQPLYPDLWDDDATTPDVVDFSIEVSNTGSDLNTFGRAAGDDGWDWADDVYGTTTGTNEFHYAAWEAGGADADGTPGDNSSRIEVQLGPSHQNGDDLPPGGGGTWPDIANPGGSDWYSAAWGVEFNLTAQMYTVLQLGGTIKVDFDWEAVDTGRIYDLGNQGTEEDCYIKSRFGNSTGYYYLGTDLGGDAEAESFFCDWGTNANAWGPYSGNFLSDITQYIDSPGPFYLDFGGLFGGGMQSGREGMRAYFDNVSMAIYPRYEQDILINGTPGDKFGFSVSGAGKINNDNFDDILIGAPGNDNPNGIDSGAIYVFLSNGSLDSTLEAADDASFVNYGEAYNDTFGRAVAYGGSVDGDLYSEVLVGAPYNDTYQPGLMPDAGKAYVLSMVKKPDISLNYPVGGEMLNGSVIINATAIDPDDNLDTGGVRFYYSTDMLNWTLIGSNATLTPENGFFYYMTWNTSLLSDGTYYLKVNVSDLDLNLDEDFSSSFTLDNQFPPLVNITNPIQNEVIYGLYQINATGEDSPLDLIGGGINNTLGMRFYYSDDNVTWHIIGNDTYPQLVTKYDIQLDTTILNDGMYWLKANITDIDDMVGEAVVEFEIDNPARAPFVELLQPRNVVEVTGVIVINATAYDRDNNINSSGVSFYYSTDAQTWVFLDNVPTPDSSLIYEISWDTTTVDDGMYWVKAFVNDTTNLTASNRSDKFKIHNSISNPPDVTVIYPNLGEELRVNVKLEADAYDLDDNLDSDGVKYYYSSDNVEWIYIGNKPTPDSPDGSHFTYIWNTLKVPDGRYWMNASANDTTFLTGWDHSDEPFFIHNSQLNPPIVDVIYPNGGEVLTGKVTVEANAGDLEDNIDEKGVSFYYSSNKLNWTLIDNVPSPTSPIPVLSFIDSYALSWDTTAVPDGAYWLKANATDTHVLTGEDLSDEPFFIHNNEFNAPIVNVLYPNGGEELNGTVQLQSSAFDLEKNLDIHGVKFYYSSDKTSWHLIGNESVGKTIENKVLEKLYVLSWDTTAVPDGIYWLKANATDLTDLVGSDLSDDSFIIHNRLDNPPKVKIITPHENDTIGQSITILVEVTDLEGNIKEVRFYYSEDNETWVLIGTATAPTAVGGNTYSYTWSTEDLYEGEYWLKVVAVDNDSNEGVAYSGRVFVDNENVKSKDKEPEDIMAGLWWLWIILIIIIIILCLLAVVWNKKRKEQKMQETLAGMSPQAIPIKAAGAPGAPAAAGPPLPTAETKPELAAGATPKLMLPSAQLAEGEDAGKDFQAKIANWKSQGYNVSRLEDLIETDMDRFWSVLPVFINNINKLDGLKPRFNALDTTGYEAEADSIRKKLNEPDLALAVENELFMLEGKVEQKEKLAEEETADEAKTEKEEAAADFDKFLPTDQPAQPEGAEAEAPVPGILPEVPSTTEEETAADDVFDKELESTEVELKEELEAADKELDDEAQDDQADIEDEDEED